MTRHSMSEEWVTLSFTIDDASWMRIAYEKKLNKCIYNLDERNLNGNVRNNSEQ